MAIKSFLPDEIVFRENETGDRFYQVLAGQVEVFIGYESDDERQLTLLGPGTFFGEIAALGAYPRTATIVTSGSGATLLELSADTLTESFNDNPMLILTLLQNIGRRIVSLSKDCDEAHQTLDALKDSTLKPAVPSLLDKAKTLAAYFFGPGKNADGTTLEKEIESGNYKHLRDGYSMQVFTCGKGSVLFREEDPGACMYAVHFGRVGIYSGYGTDKERKITDLYADSFFGEIGMLCGLPRSATAVVLEDDTTLEIIKPEDIAELFKNNPPKVLMILEHLIRRLRSLTAEYADVCKEICSLQ